jgi:hypothetical protein
VLGRRKAVGVAIPPKQGLAEKHLRRAVALDPSRAAAHLRLALLPNLSARERRAELELAIQGRASLSDRDQARLQAVCTRYVPRGSTTTGRSTASRVRPKARTWTSPPAARASQVLNRVR